jgi:hypothetical protein
MVGFMKQCIKMESRVKKRRFAVYKHLPSYMRVNPLGDSDNSNLRRSWDTKKKEEYLTLTNRRSKIIKDLINNRGHLAVREIYEKQVIEKWARTGLMFTGSNPNSQRERTERLQELLRLLKDHKADEYDVKVTSTTLYFPFLICDDEMVIDVGRQTKRKFAGPLGGLYCNKKKIIKEYVDFFGYIWESINEPEESERKMIIAWLEGLLKEIYSE